MLGKRVFCRAIAFFVFFVGYNASYAVINNSNFSGDPHSKDTISEFIGEYDDLNNFSFDGLSDEVLIHYIDSLFSLDQVPKEFLNRINLYLSIKDKDEAALSALIDSLLTLSVVPVDFINRLNLYLSVKGKSDEEIYAKIDSLFELDEIPYPLINQINYYVATRTSEAEELNLKEIAITTFYDKSLYPANCFYESWDTKNTNPYSDQLWKTDSIHTLVIEDSVNFCNYVHPINGIVTSNFGWRDGRNHNGVDIDLRTGAPVVAAFDGMVRVARNQGSYGNVVVIRHYNGLETLYAHLHKIKVKPGQVINAGQLIGLGGNTGRSTGSHLHFEIRFKGKPINPKYLISFKEKQLFSDTFIFKKTKSSYTVFPEGTTFHTVKKGDYPYAVADRYGLSIGRLCELNAISKKSKLKVGQQLRIN